MAEDLAKNLVDHRYRILAHYAVAVRPEASGQKPVARSQYSIQEKVRGTILDGFTQSSGALSR